MPESPASHYFSALCLEFAAVLVRLVDACPGQCDLDCRGHQPDAPDLVFGVHLHAGRSRGGGLTELATQRPHRAGDRSRSPGPRERRTSAVDIAAPTTEIPEFVVAFTRRRRMEVFDTAQRIGQPLLQRTVIVCRTEQLPLVDLARGAVPGRRHLRALTPLVHRGGQVFMRLRSPSRWHS